jgi:sulfate adenylyltransferase
MRIVEAIAPTPPGRFCSVSGGVVNLHEDGMAVLDQALLGLLPPSALDPAEVYTDAEGTPVATRDGDTITPLRESRWQRPDPATDAPVVVAVADEVPVGSLPTGNAILLLPAGGVRIDDARFAAWAQAWRSVAGTVIEVPVPPREAAARAATLAAAYSSGELLTVGTVAMPSGDGHVVFFTGLSGSGKSTLARAVTERLAGTRTVTLLDGDVVRTHLSKGLGFSREDRDTNIRRIGWVAAEIAKHGGVAVCAPIAPYDDTRRWVRETVERAAGPTAMLLVWVSTPLEVCEQRDTKGLYAKARAGELTGFTGIDDPYEPPADADLVVDTSVTSLDDAVGQVIDLLGDPR